MDMNTITTHRIRSVRGAKLKFLLCVLKCIKEYKIQLTVFLFCCKGQVYFRFIDIKPAVDSIHARPISVKYSSDGRIYIYIFI